MFKTNSLNSSIKALLRLNCVECVDEDIIFDLCVMAFKNFASLAMRFKFEFFVLCQFFFDEKIDCQSTLISQQYLFDKICEFADIEYIKRLF